MKISENAEKLKFGVICTGTQFRSWQVQCINDLISMDNVELSLLIIEDKSEINFNDRKNDVSAKISFLNYDAKESIIAKPMKSIKNILLYFLKFNLFFLYRRKFVITKAYQPVDLTEFLRNTNRIFCKVNNQGKFSQYFQDDDLKIVEDYALDFILKFGYNSLQGEILNIPKYGVWSFHHDDEEKYRGGPPCFWEIFYNDSITGATIGRAHV